MPAKTFRLTDTLSGQVKPLATLEPDHLRFYSCGPTVYSYAHIGNFRSFLTADLVVRTARAIGWRVTWVSNITDVGHLTDDDVADAQGEDKMERALRSKEGEQFHNVWELSEYYTEAYREDWRNLNMVEPEIRPKATQHVREQIVAVEELIKNGHAYETPTGVYFSIESFPDYGKLSGNTRDNLRKAVREAVVVDENKRESSDFALWKKDDKHLMQWFSPYGWGFPGWHIECTVMAMKYLGETLDLHSGGEDNRFPHHECEIAQSESLTGKPFSNHWLHTRFLLVDGEKMSKSKGNFYTVRDLLAKGADPLAVRLALMSTHFTKELNFTEQGLNDATGNVERLRRADHAVAAALEAKRDGEDVLGTLLEDLGDQALDAMCNDLNTSVALAKALEGARAITREAEGMSMATAESSLRFLDRINDLLGIVRSQYGDAKAECAPPAVDASVIEAKIAERAEAKRAKEFARADAIRQELDSMGIELRDTPQGTVWVAKSAGL
ncbi:cysteine--tRNA ligase [Fimbriimonas ginsengisoli]|uniref:Cysteine--tRNA ligase n=1 Tax=Fimbriimonas ginsengisoli Gsoil 348 TaxID=661478 RepID=A0A068NUY8_FIMGI|nr:cysteine--tRNA ligase [Fimbriimonas ginsengisoli]AIE86545.1 cysteinyl-tRNA synthetase [Fimbriimonas ginsengisoli Gsoil 348]